MDEEQKKQVALFRYGVIRDLVAGPLAPGAKERIMAEVANRIWTIPGSSRVRVGRSTVRDWVTLYELYGFAGLEPVPRGPGIEPDTARRDPGSAFGAAPDAAEGLNRQPDPGPATGSGARG
ncbi:MAG TPA: helix-turn-helix domain-containing protein [Thermoanaerobaculia bacterium]